MNGLDFQYNKASKNADGITNSADAVTVFGTIVNCQYLKVTFCPKLLISQSEFSDPKNFTLRYQYSLIQMKCQGGNKYALSITVKFDQSTRRFGRISFARLFKFTKHIALLFHHHIYCRV